MFCKNCGTMIPEGSAFCPNCGNPVQSTNTVVPENIPEEVPAPQPVVSEPVPEPQPTVPELQPTVPAPQSIVPDPVPVPQPAAPEPMPEPQPAYYDPNPMPTPGYGQNQTPAGYGRNPIPPSYGQSMVPPPNYERYPVQAAYYDMKPAESVYHGKSLMQTFRTVSGIMLLVSILFLVLNNAMNYVIIRYFYGMEYSFFRSYSISILSGAIMPLILGVASLVLARPTRTKSIILTALSGSLILSNIAGIFLHWFTPAGRPLDLLVLLQNIFPAHLILIFVMALVSIFQPEHLVGEPRPVSGRGWKIASGILHLLSGGTLFLAAAGTGILLVGRSAVYYSMASIAVSLFGISVYVLIAGIVTLVSAKSKNVPLAAAHTQLLALSAIFSLLSSLLQSMIMGGGIAITDDAEVIATILILGYLILLFIWFLICFIITLVGALKKGRSVY